MWGMVGAVAASKGSTFDRWYASEALVYVRAKRKSLFTIGCMISLMMIYSVFARVNAHRIGTVCVCKWYCSGLDRGIEHVWIRGCFELWSSWYSLGGITKTINSQMCMIHGRAGGIRTLWTSEVFAPIFHLMDAHWQAVIHRNTTCRRRPWVNDASSDLQSQNSQASTTHAFQTNKELGCKFLGLTSSIRQTDVGWGRAYQAHSRRKSPLPPQRSISQDWSWWPAAIDSLNEKSATDTKW